MREGWRGLVEPIFEELGPQQVSGILPRGGTIIGTSRTNPFTLEGGVERVLQNFRDRASTRSSRSAARTRSASRRACSREHQLPVVGVPKTIDNDLSGTDYTFGFDTAVFIATEAIDRLHTTAESHNRVMVVEVMGRHTGWIAVMRGIAGGADVILVPEHSRSTSRRSRRRLGSGTRAARTSPSSSSAKAASCQGLATPARNRTSSAT